MILILFKLFTIIHYTKKLPQLSTVDKTSQDIGESDPYIFEKTTNSLPSFPMNSLDLKLNEEQTGLIDPVGKPIYSLDEGGNAGNQF